MSALPTLEQVAHAVRTARFRYVDEDQLQAGIEAALHWAGLSCEREVTIEKGCRVDLLVGRIAVEAKVKGSTSEVARQVRRYLESGKLDGVVVVTTRVSHLSLERLLADERLTVVTLAGDGL